MRIMNQTTIFQALSDETRLRALALMHHAGELCVCELVHALELSQPKISRHMAAMRDAGIVDSRRHAQWVFYFIAPSLPAWQSQIIDAAVAGLAGEAASAGDRKRLATMTGRPQRASAA